MADITKCTGNGCPMKDLCYRHTAPNSEQQSWFVDIPGDYVEEIRTFPNPRDNTRTLQWKCDMYWGKQQTAIMDTLTNIFKGQ